MGRKELSEELSELRFARWSEEEVEEEWSGEPGGLDGLEEALERGGLSGWGGSRDVGGMIVGRGEKAGVPERGFAGRVLGVQWTSCE